MSPEEAMRANADLVIDKLSRTSGLGNGFGYNRESVSYVIDFVEGQRHRSDDQFVAGLVNVLGSFLGECIIQAYGGVWTKIDGQWSVSIKDGLSAFPFNKVRKQFSNGIDAGDSILGFFDACGVLERDRPDREKS